MSDQKARVYQTEDINLVAYLRCKDFKFNQHLSKRGSTIIFSFAEDAAIKDEVLRYYNGDCLVEPGRFADCLRQIKGFIKLKNKEE